MKEAHSPNQPAEIAADASDPRPSGQKIVYISLLLHANMCYDRYPKQEIREKFPQIYGRALRAMHEFPEITAHIDFPGLTWLSLKHHAPWVLEELTPLLDRGQVILTGCQYAASHAMCSDEESDLVACRTSLDILRRESGREVSTFFPQEIAFHPQMPFLMNQVGLRRLIVMPDGWHGPKRVRGIDGSEVDVYPLNLRTVQFGNLEAYYDSQPDGGFVMTGGDFEMLGNLRAFADEIRRLEEKGKIVRWTTVERYEAEVGAKERIDAAGPFGQGLEDGEASPSFSRWTAHPEDAIWHGRAVKAMDAIRTAEFAKLAAAVRGLGEVDAPIEESRIPPPDNAWDSRFEEASEFPETEGEYLAPGGRATISTRAWHHLLIGLNSDSSGWFPWSPRTRHRDQVLDASIDDSRELLFRFSRRLSERLRAPAFKADAWALALNPGPERMAEASLKVDRPMEFFGSDGTPIPTAISFKEGEWTATARIRIPAYGYRLFGLKDGFPVRASEWTAGDAAALGPRRVTLSEGRLKIAEGANSVEARFAPFLLRDPSGAAPEETAKPDWSRVTTRVRETLFGPELEVLTELAWAVWLRLVIGLREDRIEIAADIHADLPRRIGGPGYDPDGLTLEFNGRPGRAFYDVPYATIEHRNPNPSYVAAQRFVAMESGDASFALIALDGDQAFKLSASEGILAASLGASIQGRPDARPQCILHPDGSSEHRIASDGDPFHGSYSHRYALLFEGKEAAARMARALRSPVAPLRVRAGAGDWPWEGSLLNISPDSACVTAFRSGGGARSVVLNDLSGRPALVKCQGRTIDLPAYGAAVIDL